MTDQGTTTTSERDRVREEVRDHLHEVTRVQVKRVFDGFGSMIGAQGVALKAAFGLGAMAAMAFGSLVADAVEQSKAEIAKAKAKLEEVAAADKAKAKH